MVAGQLQVVQSCRSKTEIRTEASGNIQTFQIVGVDEADIYRGKVSFISPIARVLINKKVGDKVILKQAGKDIVFEIIGISYK